MATGPDRAIVVELACFLALHPGRAFPGDELRFLLRPDGETEISAKSLRSYVSLLRTALGSDVVPSAAAVGYTISPQIGTDWSQFQLLSGPDAGKAELEAALALVRGRPFAGVPAGTYGWVFSELLVSEIEAQISSVTERLFWVRADERDWDGALWASRQGLLAVPGDTGLWEMYLACAREVGPAEWIAARREAHITLGDAAARWG